MDSFFSLFDPSDGQSKQNHKKRHKSADQENAKKNNADAPKGRRRGRRSQGKSEALPEESSFLCEPELDCELLVKDCSYIENYIEVHKDKGRRRGRRSQGKSEALPEESSFLCEPELDCELLVKDCSYIENYIEVHKDKDSNAKQDPDKKPRRRNSARKSRRKKNRISPGKEPSPDSAWSGEPAAADTSWNNQTDGNQRGDQHNRKDQNNHKDRIPKPTADIGKNVNDLTDDFKKAKRKNDADNSNYNDNSDSGNYHDKSDSGNYHDKVNNVIDKLEKLSIDDDFYLSGDFNAEDLDNDFFYNSDDVDEYCDDTTSDAEDSGDECYGSLPPEPRFGNVEYKLQLVSPCERRFQHLVTQLKWRLRSGGGNAVYVVGVRDCGALRGLRARALRASLHALRGMARAIGAGIVAARARRVAPHRAVAEVYIRKLADPQQSVELRVAVLGANEAGKSTLIGVLTQGELDNGRGSARLNMFRHLHEVRSGRTSSLSHEILGFDAQGNVVNYGCSELMTAERIGERSARLLSFLDLAGHSKYQRTTVHGLTGYSPHYAMCVISATAGVARITEEHIGLLLALDLPFFAVINKCELAPAAVAPLVERLRELLQPANKKPLLITDENMARDCVVQQKSILDTIDLDQDPVEKEEDSGAAGTVAVFPVSCARGDGLNALHAYLLALQPPAPDERARHDDDTCEFQIDEIFHVGDSAGPVVGGLLARGRLYEGDEMIIGPLETGEFVRTSVRTIYRNRVRCGSVAAGQSGSVGLRAAPPALRAGMVLLSPPRARTSDATDGGGRSKEPRSRRSVRRKDKNFLNDIANAESRLSKDISVQDNLYREVKETVETYSCDEDEVLLEDPNDPRGCIYFQASVHVLRHSTAIYPGFQCSVHVGNVRQTAIIEGILSGNNELRAGERASVVFRFARCPEYLVRGRRLLFTAGLGTRAIGRVTQVFPHVP